MPFTITNGLCALSDVKAALRIPTADTTDDDRISLAIDAASRQIEYKLKYRRFWQDSVPSGRLFIAESPFLCPVDDFMTTAGLIVQTDPYGDGSFAVTWNAADFQLEPLNGLLEGSPWPYTKMRAVRSLLFPVYGGIAYPLPYVQALIKVTAQWGWSSIPTPVQKACIVQAISLFKADDTPFGATPFGEVGVVRLKDALHPTAAALLQPFDRFEVMVA